MGRFLLPVLVLSGCISGFIEGADKGGSDDSAADAADDSGPEDTEPEQLYCDTLSLDIGGPDEPVVGDVWYVWVDCDGARLLGGIVVRYEPVEAASLDENVLTFLESGEGMVVVRAGTTELTQAVDVGEAPPARPAAP